MSGYRTIVVDGSEWKYKIGFCNIVVRHLLSSKGFHTTHWGLMNTTPDVVEHCDWKGSWHITPADIARWIKTIPPQKLQVKKSRR